jgi:hypothetical protein
MQQKAQWQDTVNDTALQKLNPKAYWWQINNKQHQVAQPTSTL